MKTNKRDISDNAEKRQPKQRMRGLLTSPVATVILNLLVMYVVYFICRIVFVACNWQLFGADMTWPLAWNIFCGSLRFDTSAILYTNLLYLLVVLLPLHSKETPLARRVARWTYIIPNALAVVANLMDTVYFPYSQRRTTMSVFKEFGDNTNIGDVILVECVNHWYLVLLAVILIWGIWRLYTPMPVVPTRPLKKYYTRSAIVLVVAFPLIWMGLRGNSIFHINRPISETAANEYVNSPVQAGIVVNTPFSLIRSSKKTAVEIPQFYATLAEAESVMDPVHMPADSVKANRRNVVIILLESFSEEFIGAMKRDGAGDTFVSQTPFLDSLYHESLTYSQTFANGWMSTDGIPHVHASLPKMFYGYTTSSFALNETPGIAHELSTMGYSNAYFHGAEEASLGLKGSARSTGITEYYGMESYLADPRFGNKDDYDGTWGIWDDRFMQYFCTKLGDMRQPFVATLFTLNSHHPFNIPDRCEAMFPDDDPDYPVKRCIRYTDWSLRQFFESAKRQPWYKNTLFVITADHCYHNIIREAYRTQIGQFRIPILFFDPSGDLKPGVRDGIAQQIDVMPTLLGYLGYDKPYVAFGKDLFNTDADDTWAFQYHDVPQYIKGDYLIQMEGFKLSAVYRYKTDFMLKHNLLQSGDYDHAFVDGMVRELQALLQSIDTRLRDNSLRKVDVGARPSPQNSKR